MLDEIRERIGAYLAGHRVGVVATAGSVGARGMPVRYRASGLEVDLLIPSWADVACVLEEFPEVLLVVWCADGDRLRWMEYHGISSPAPASAAHWAGLLPAGTASHQGPLLYRMVHVTPVRIDLFDESQGWGARETLEV